MLAVVTLVAKCTPEIGDYLVYHLNGEVKDNFSLLSYSVESLVGGIITGDVV